MNKLFAFAGSSKSPKHRKKKHRHKKKKSRSRRDSTGRSSEEDVREKLKDNVDLEEIEEAVEEKEDSINSDQYEHNFEENDATSNNNFTQHQMQNGSEDADVYRKAVEDHARYLGIDPYVDYEYLWIAEQAITAELPEGWQQTENEDGVPYYFNETLQESKWEHPRDQEFRDLFHMEKKNKENITPKPEIPQPHTESPEQPLDIRPDPSAHLVTQLELTKSNLETELNDIKLDLSERNNMIKAFKSSETSKNQKLYQLERQIVELKRQQVSSDIVDNLTSKLSTMEDTNQTLESTIVDLKAQLSSLTLKLKTTSAQTAATRNDEKDARISILEEEITFLRNNIQSEDCQGCAGIDGLKEEIKTLQDHLEQERSKVSAFSQESLILQKTKDKLNQLKVDKEHLNVQLAIKEKLHEELQRSNTKLEDTIENKDRKLESMTSLVETKTEAYQNLKIDLTTVKALLEEEKSRHSNTRNELSIMNVSLKASQESCHNLGEQCRILEFKHTELSKQLSAKNEFTAGEEKMIYLEKEVELHLASLSAQQTRYHEVVNEKRAIDQKLDTTQDELKQTRQEMRGKIDELNRIRIKLLNEQKDKLVAEEQLKTSKQEITFLEASLVDLRKVKNKLEKTELQEQQLRAKLSKSNARVANLERLASRAQRKVSPAKVSPKRGKKFLEESSSSDTAWDSIDSESTEKLHGFKKVKEIKLRAELEKLKHQNRNLLYRSASQKSNIKAQMGKFFADSAELSKMCDFYKSKCRSASQAKPIRKERSNSKDILLNLKAQLAHMQREMTKVHDPDNIFIAQSPTPVRNTHITVPQLDLSYADIDRTFHEPRSDSLDTIEHRCEDLQRSICEQRNRIFKSLNT